MKSRKLASYVMNDIEICNNLLYEQIQQVSGLQVMDQDIQKGLQKISIHHNKFYKTGINPGV